MTTRRRAADDGGGLAAYNKAWAAVLTPIVALVATLVGLDLSEEAAGAITAALTGLAVWRIPNLGHGTGVARRSRARP